MERRYPGWFVTFEGLDGCGKTTQLRKLASRLRAAGRTVVETVEPGGTRIGDQIRRILLDAANQELCATAELLLYFASRAQNVEELILPALERGDVVLSDRFTDSSLVYQGVGRRLGAEAVAQLERLACRGLKPDLTLVIDVDPEASLARTRARWLGAEESRMDQQAEEFHGRVRDAYLRLAGSEPGRVRLIDGRPDAETVAVAVWAAVAAALEAKDVR